MKPKHYKPQYAVAQTVADMARKFVFPDEDTLPAPPFVGGGGGAPTVVVASATASEISKRKSDIQAAGVADDQAIMAARELGGDNARILLTEGNFVVNPSRISLGAACHLQGMGWGTIIETAATAGTMIATDARTIISDLVIRRSAAATNTLIGIETGVGNLVLRCRFDNVNVGVDVAGNTTQVRGCVAETVNTFVDVAGAAENVVIAHNPRVQRINLDGSFYTAVVGNTILSDSNGIEVSPDPSAGLVIASNTINCDVTGILLNGETIDSIIQGNTLVNTTTGIHIDTAGTPCERIAILGNVIGVEGFLGEDGVILDSAKDCMVGLNTIVFPGQDTDNTHDGIRLEGDADRNVIQGNRIIGSASAPQPRYGINVSAATCDCNIVVGNALGDPADYGTDALNDAGTNTQLFWPNDPTYGDNFTDCPPSSS